MEQLMKLGKLSAKHDMRTLQFADYYILPTVPLKRSWSDAMTNIGVMCNNRLGNCTIATSGHAIQLWSANNGNQIILPDQVIVDGYSELSGYDPKTGLNDNGCYELDVVKYLRNTGLGGHKIFAFTGINRNDSNLIDLIKGAIELFGCIRLCAELPLSAQEQSRNNLWVDPKGNLHGRNKYGSWGGHSFLGVGFDEQYVYVISWGKIIKVEWGWMTAYGSEYYAVLSNMDWIKNNIAPNNFNVEQLQYNLANIH